MDRRNLAFDKVNFILLAIGMDIFSTRRIVVAPTVTLIGFLSIIYAVIRKPKDN